VIDRHESTMFVSASRLSTVTKESHVPSWRRRVNDNNDIER
jgi:hypothetical protein